MSAYIYCMVFSYLYYFCLPVWRLLMSAYLYDAYLSIWCSVFCVMSSYLYDVCLHVWRLLNCAVWCLLKCMISAYLFYCMISAYLYNFFLPVRCLLSAWCLPPLWCFPTCMIFAQLYDVCLPVRLFPTCIMSAYLYDVRFLPTFMKDFFIPVWCLIFCSMSS